MIPVIQQPEPDGFDRDVRKPGQAWLITHSIAPGSAPIKAGDLPDYWSKTQKNLWRSYGGTCAYLAIYFAWPLGASSTDHFIPKALDAWKAYEWSNYRLSALGPNRRKGKKTNILDPFTMHDATFLIDFASGNIIPNPDITASLLALAVDTIIELDLNEQEVCRHRCKFFNDYLRKDISERKLKELSPFVHYEMYRQGFIP
jgi:hypothetical protein